MVAARNGGNVDDWSKLDTIRPASLSIFHCSLAGITLLYCPYPLMVSSIGPNKGTEVCCMKIACTSVSIAEPACNGGTDHSGARKSGGAVAETLTAHANRREQKPREMEWPTARTTIRQTRRK
jgi:hypothetical protein